jgi:hypothetical protein
MIADQLSRGMPSDASTWLHNGVSEEGHKEDGQDIDRKAKQAFAHYIPRREADDEGRAKPGWKNGKLLTIRALNASIQQRP